MPWDPDSICPNCLEAEWNGSHCAGCSFELEKIDQSNDKLSPGTILNGHYHVGLVLGHEGGFGVTYKGRDLASGDKVAIKEYMPSQLAGRSNRSQDVRPLSESHANFFAHGLMRFRQEAETLRGFTHPAIVKVVDYFEGNRTGYLVMPFVEGMTLAEYVARKGKKIGFELALNILTPVMDALRYAHARKLIHRDVSPENIYITMHGHVILLDFGAARSPIPGLELTRIWKVGYSPREVILGHTQGQFTDVYGLAATLYAVCSGQEPPTYTDRLEREILVPLSRCGVAIPISCESALTRALSIRAEDRFQSIAEFQEKLSSAKVMEDSIESSEETNRAVDSTPNHTKDGPDRSWLVFVGIVIVIVLLGIILFF
jgi:serine/threonine protein kinase